MTAYLDNTPADRILWLEDDQFKDIIEMAVDPACGMSVDRASAPAQTTDKGQVFYFCARGCRDQFPEASEQYRSDRHQETEPM